MISKFKYFLLSTAISLSAGAPKHEANKNEIHDPRPLDQLSYDELKSFNEKMDTQIAEYTKRIHEKSQELASQINTNASRLNELGSRVNAVTSSVGQIEKQQNETGNEIAQLSSIIDSEAKNLREMKEQIQNTNIRFRSYLTPTKQSTWWKKTYKNNRHLTHGCMGGITLGCMTWFATRNAYTQNQRTLFTCGAIGLGSLLGYASASKIKDKIKVKHAQQNIAYRSAIESAWWKKNNHISSESNQKLHKPSWWSNF